MRILLLVLMLGMVLAASVLGLQTIFDEKSGKDVDSLIKDLKDDDSTIRANAAKALGNTNDTRAVEPLILAFKDNDWLVRWNAALALGSIGKPALEPLIQALKDNDSEVRGNAAYALGEIKDARAVEPLIQSLKDNNSSMRGSAAQALGMLNDTHAVAPLIQALMDNDSKVRNYAAWSLGNIRDVRAVDPLIETLKDNSSIVRLSSAEALGKIKDKKAAGPLIYALNDTDYDVRSKATWALVDWTKKFSGPKDDYFNAGREIHDGGYILAGITKSYGDASGDTWLLRTDSNGTEIWNKTFGGSGRDEGMDVLEVDDGGFIVVGETESFGSGDKDAWLIKTDSSGNEQWNRTFGGPNEDIGLSIKKTNEGDYVLAGTTESYGAGNRDLWLIKTDSIGRELWNRTFGGPGQDEGFSVMLTQDGGYIVTGYATPIGSGQGDFWLIKTDSNGREMWNRTFGGSSSSEEVAFSADRTKDGGYIIAGGKDQNTWIIKTDSAGREQWNRTFEPYKQWSRSMGLSVKQTKDGGYIIGGYTGSSIEYYRLGWFFDSRPYIIKVDSKGSEEWSTVIDNLGSSKAYRVDETKDGGYIIIGDLEEIGPSIYNSSYRGWDAWLIKLTSGQYSLAPYK
ncbi:MAG TPA: HEAT repeat domain-containing protein [Methanotrichaceae archaeon]|nr:HEAT repeat domain-containing protein [Methanotrichaceae archaeon]